MKKIKRKKGSLDLIELFTPITLSTFYLYPLASSKLLLLLGVEVAVSQLLYHLRFFVVPK
jgi:hypothetical protein